MLFRHPLSPSLNETSCRERRPKIRVHEVIALVEDWLALLPGQRIADAVAKIQFCPMSTAFTVIAISLAGDPSLRYCNGFNDNFRINDDFVKAGAQDWVAQCVDHS